MIFTAYFDETDTHGSQPTIIMVGIIGHAHQWKRFEKKLARIQREHGFKIFTLQTIRLANKNSKDGLTKNVLA